MKLYNVLTVPLHFSELIKVPQFIIRMLSVLWFIRFEKAFTLCQILKLLLKTFETSGETLEVSKVFTVTPLPQIQMIPIYCWYLHSDHPKYKTVFEKQYPNGILNFGALWYLEKYLLKFLARISLKVLIHDPENGGKDLWQAQITE